MYFRNPSSVFGAYTLDVIASTGFGVDIDSQKNPDSEFVKNAKKFFNITFNPLLLMICKFLNEYPCVYGEENVLEWGGEEIVFLHYFILEIQFLYIFIFIETNKKWQNCTLQKT